MRGPRRRFPVAPGQAARGLLSVATLALVAAGCSRGPDAGDLHGWNVLLITIDTLRADRVGFSGGPETPALDALAEEGVVFEDAVAAAPVTLPSHATILSGRYPPAHGALDNGFYSLPEDVPTLATLLRDEGYRTGAIVGAFVLHRQYGLDRGFELYDDRFRQPRRADQLEQERRAEEISARARAWLAATPADRPFFLWVHYFDPHAPYAPPEPWLSRFRGRGYDGEIAYTDAAVGALLEALRESGRGDRTLVVLTADHGEALGDGGEPTHGLLLRNATLRVPLVVKATGGLPSGRRVPGTVSTADIAPTVLELVGVPPPEGLDGRSLTPAMREGRAEDRRAYSETRLPVDLYGWAMLAGARDDRWAWVRGPRPELYDLTTDPGESRNLAGGSDGGDAARELDALVEGILSSQRGDTRRDALSPEEREALAALGYAAAPEGAPGVGADPKDMLGVWHRLAEAQGLLAANRTDEALAALDAIVARDPGNRDARLTRAQALVQAGRREEGAEELRALAGAAPSGREGAMIADGLARAGAPREAEALLRALMETDPELPDHAFNLGNLLLTEGRAAEAVEAYRRALDLNPDAVAVLINLSQALASAEGAAAADEIAARMDRAIRLSPEDDRPRIVKIDLCRAVGDVEEARRAAAELAARQPLRGVTPQEAAAAVRRAGL